MESWNCKLHGIKAAFHLSSIPSYWKWSKTTPGAMPDFLQQQFPCWDAVLFLEVGRGKFTSVETWKMETLSKTWKNLHAIFSSISRISQSKDGTLIPELQQGEWSNAH